MAEFAQSDLGVYGSGLKFPFGLVGPLQVVFTNVEFPFDVKLYNMGMQMGCAYGLDQNGNFVPKTGGFYGRYCIWDSSGNLLAQTNIVTQNVDYGFNINRPYTYGSFTSQPVLKAGVTYRLGFYRASASGSTATSLTAWSRGTPTNRRAYFNNAKVQTWQVDSGASSIPVGGWSQYFQASNSAYYLGMLFRVGYEKANSGAKRWNGSVWEDRGILKWNGGSWDKIPLQEWNGGSWADVN